MRIGAIGSYGLSDYRVSAVYGNPRSLQPIEKIGRESSYGDTTAVLEKTAKTPVPQEEAKQPVRQAEPVDYQNLMDRMKSMTRFSADTIPMDPAI